LLPRQNFFLKKIITNRRVCTLTKSLTVLLSIFGGITLFWFGFTSRIPRDFYFLVNLSEASNLLSQITLALVASGFFGRILFLFVYYSITQIWDTLRNFESKSSKTLIRKTSFYLNSARRKMRKGDIYVTSVLSMIMLNLFLFDKINYWFIFILAFLSLLIYVSLRLLLFRVARGNSLAFFVIPKGVSKYRVANLQLYWIVSSYLLICFASGIEMAEQRLQSNLCLEKDGNIQQLSILIKTEHFLIVSQSNGSDERRYSAIPIDSYSISQC
jgi:hypothetical protein